MKLVDIEPVIEVLKTDVQALPKAEDGTDEYEKGYNEGYRAAMAHMRMILKLLPPIIREAK